MVDVFYQNFYNEVCPKLDRSFYRSYFKFPFVNFLFFPISGNFMLKFKKN